MPSKGQVVGAILFIIGLAIFVDDLHDFVPGTEWLHWLPDFTPVFIGSFHFEQLSVSIPTGLNKSDILSGKGI